MGPKGLKRAQHEAGGQPRVWLLLVLMLLAAAAVRLIGITAMSPPGVAHDEVANWLIDRAILDEGRHGVYFTQAYGHEAGYHYLQAGSVALLGDNLLALRLPSAFIGLLSVAVTYALANLLFGQRVALLSAALLAGLFWPVFYSRLGLRAISLPLVSGLAVYFWWRGWLSDRRTLLFFALSGLLAGATLYTYPASRAGVLFFALFGGYLFFWHRSQLRRHWRGLLLFGALFTLIALPLVWYLGANPGAEFRVAEVSGPLQELRAGNWRPVLGNGVKLLGMFGFVGDPLWREGVPGEAVFGPLLALLFYLGLAATLWRWRDSRAGFLLLWLGTAVSPSLVTINAPSHIRAINLLLILTLFPALFLQPQAWRYRTTSHKFSPSSAGAPFDIKWGLMHSFPKLSTVLTQLSTKIWENIALMALTILGFAVLKTSVLLFLVWPTGGDVPFVWQTALAQVAQSLSAGADLAPAAIAGWSAETLDRPSLTLLLNGRAAPASHFQPGEGSLILPDSPHPVVIRPAALPLDPFWEAQLPAWGALSVHEGQIVRYNLPARPELLPELALNVSFGGEIILLGLTMDACAARSACGLTTIWRVTAVPDGARQLFFQVLDEEGHLTAESFYFDRQDPQSLWFPHWQIGDYLLQRHLLPPTETAVELRLGWFDPYTCSPGPCQNLLTESGAGFVVLPLPGRGDKP